MAWPISAFGAPNWDSGIVTLTTSFVNIPNGPGAAATGWALGILLINLTGAVQTVTLQDGNSAQVLPAIVLQPNEVKPLPFEFMPLIGAVQWKASNATSVNAKMWGYV